MKWKSVKKLLDAQNTRMERILIFMAALNDAVSEKNGLPPILVGGATVEYYTEGEYATDDLDVLCPVEVDSVAETLREWGFGNRSGGNMFSIPEEDLFVHLCGTGEIDDNPRKTIRANDVRVGEGFVRMISFEDILLDRLKACVHWHHEGSCGQFLRMITKRVERGECVDTKYMRSSLKRDGDNEALLYLGKTLSDRELLTDISR